MSNTINQNELIASLNKIKSYIDNNAIQLKVEDAYIYYKTLTEDEWTILLDMGSIVMSNDIEAIKNIKLRKGEYNIEWQYEDEKEWHKLIALSEITGTAGLTFTPHVDEDGLLSWTNNGGVKNPNPINIKGDSCFIPHNIKTFVNDVGPEGYPNAYIDLAEDNSKITFTFDIPRGKNGTVRTGEFSSLKTNSKNVLEAINELKATMDEINEKLTEIENRLNDLENN